MVPRGLKRNTIISLLWFNRDAIFHFFFLGFITIIYIEYIVYIVLVLITVMVIIIKKKEMLAVSGGQKTTRKIKI